MPLFVRLLLLLLCFAPVAAAQERRASVRLDDGRVLEGIVLAMDLATLQLQVGHEVQTIAATRIKSCHFSPLAPEDVPAPAPEAGSEPAAPPVAPTAEPAGANEAAAAETPRTPRITWTRPLPDPIDPTVAAQLPHDLRRPSLWRARLTALDEAYPWLVPVAPTQWVSIGLLLAISLTLIVHLSARVAGAENYGLGRSMTLAAWYLITTLLQVAIVTVNDLTTVLMLLGNTSLGLFWLSTLFALPRSGAVIAFAVQLGFVVAGYGVLQLVTSLLGSVTLAA